MKSSRLLFACAPLAALLTSPQLHAAVTLTEPPTTYDFPAVPAVADFSTLAVGTAIDGTITDNAGFDAKIIAAANAATITTVLGSSGTIPPSNSGVARFNTGVATTPAGITFLQTRPTGVDYILLLTPVSNDSGAAISTATVAYDYSKATDTATETIKGLRAYWSLTGTPGSWQLIPALSKDTTGTYDAPEKVSGVITFPAPIAPGGTFFLLWADQNSSGTDASYHIDNLKVSSGGAPAAVISGSAAPGTRATGASPTDPNDDIITFTTTVVGSGPVSPLGWISSDPPALSNQLTGPYGTPHPVSTPVSNFTNGTLRLTLQDRGDASATSAFNVRCPVVIGTNEAATPALPLISSTAAPANWTYDEPARTLRQNATPQGDHIVLSEEITLPGDGKAVQVSAKLIAEAGTSSGFETPDSFAFDLIIDGVAVSALGASDIDSDGRLRGADAAEGTELPGATLINTNKEFLFSSVIPATASKVQIRIIGNSNSPNETFVVSDLKLSIPGPSIAVSSTGPSVLVNNGTDSPLDDGFSAPFSVLPVNFTGSTWTASEGPTLSGPYSPPAISFGPYPVSGGPKTLSLSDQANPAILSPSFTIALPPAPTLTASGANNITLNNDGTITFDAVINGANGGPRFSVSGATASRETYGTAPVRFTIPAGVSPFSVSVTDVSYPEATQSFLINSPIEFIIGQTDFGTPATIKSTTSDTPWNNDFLARTTTINAGTGIEAIVSSEVIDLSSVGAVNFSAKFNAADTSAGSNFENVDRFRAELIIDAGLPSQQIVNLVDQWDKGNGASATAVLTNGLNGPKDGYINGYNGTAALDIITGIDYSVAPLVAEDEYNANRSRDEFNTKDEIADLSLNNDFLLSHTIPASANSVQLRFMAFGINGTETGTVSDVLFAAAAASTDNDGDGVSNTDEAIMGTDPNSAADVLRISQNPSNATQMSFPSKVGRFYRVYSSDDVNAASHLQVWKDAGLATIFGTGTTATFNINVSAGQPRRFYRLHVMEADGPWAPTRP